MVAETSGVQLELDLNETGPEEEDGPWAQGWLQRAPRSVLEDNLDRLITYVAMSNTVDLGERDMSEEEEAWNSLPESLRRVIEERERTL